MSASVFSFARRLQSRGDWANEELAELYRVEHALRQGSFCVETDRGVSDEGDPWFVFCHPDGHVVVHIARIDNLYHLFCGTLPGPLSGSSFAALTQAFVNTIPATKNSQIGGRVVAHPSAIFSLLIAAAMFSADALLHHPAGAANLPRAESGHVTFGQNGTPSAEKIQAIKVFTEAFAAAVWRDRDPEDRRVAATLQIVEQAALSFVPFEQVLSPVDVRAAGSGEAAGPPLVTAQAWWGDETSGSAALNHSSLTLERSVEENPSFLASSSQGPSVSSSVGHFAPLVYSPVTQTQFASEFARTHWDGASPLSLTAPGGAGSPGHAGILTLLLAGGAVIAPNLSGVGELDLTIAGGGGTLDLSKNVGALQLIVSGYGSLTLTHAEAAQSVEMSAGATVSIDLSYDVASAPAPLNLKLDGGVHAAVVADQTSRGLTLESSGTKSNDLNIIDSPDGPPSNFDVVIVGQQDLTVQESASAFSSSHFDASALAGVLTVGLDFSQTSSSAMVSFGASNFAATPRDNVALENLADNSSVEVGVSLSSVILGFDAGVISKGGPLGLSLNLNGEMSGSSPLLISIVEADDASNLAIVSSGVANEIQAINDGTLSHLTLSGAAALKIDQILGLTANNNQDVVVDASGMSGFLTLNTSAIADSSPSGGQISITTGVGGAAITETNAAEVVNLTLGSGPDVLNLAPGAIQITIVGLTGSGQINIGAATFVDTLVSGFAPSAAQQTSVDASGSLTLAAMASARMAASTVAHQVVLFSYQGSEYAFVDAVGDHVFNSSLDAIVKMVGLSDNANLSAVFHSA
jgi:hypothetical protein